MDWRRWLRRRRKPIVVEAVAIAPGTATVQAVGEAVVVSVASRVQAPSRWLSRHLPSPLKWLAGFEWSPVFVFGFGMIQVDEYLIADLCWAISFSCVLAKIIVWQRSTLLKAPAGVAALVVLGLLFVWTDAKRSDKAWSSMLRREKPVTTAPSVAPAQPLTAEQIASEVARRLAGLTTPPDATKLPEASTDEKLKAPKPKAAVAQAPPVTSPAPPNIPPPQKPKPPSLRVVGFQLRPIRVGDKVQVSVYIRNGTGDKVVVRNPYSISLVKTALMDVEERRAFESKLWAGFSERVKATSADALEVPSAVAGAAVLAENDEGPVMPQEFFDNAWGKGGAIYILGIFTIDGEPPVPYCGFARQVGVEFVRCVEHN